MTDMEGVSGIHKMEYTQRGEDRYEEGRRLLTADANAAIARCFDGGATEEATQLLGAIEVAPVKEGVGRSEAVCPSPTKARELIRTAAARALKVVGKIRPRKPKLPIEPLLTVTGSDYVDQIAFRPGNERLDARTVRRVVDHPLHIFDIIGDTRPAK